MERIKEALEKASKRLETASATTQTPSISTSYGAPPKPAKVETLAKFPATKQRHSEVQRVKLDMAHLEDNRIVSLWKSNPYSNYFDKLRTRILQSMQTNDWHTLVITSPTIECGKTFVSVNLAMSIAQQPDRECILVDFDLRRPRVGETLGIKASRTLADYYLGSEKIENIIVSPELQNLFVVPNAAPIPNASEILSGEKTSDLIDNLRSRYPGAIIIFDLPPLLTYDDAIAFLPSVDCALLVVAAGQSKVDDIEECQRQLQGPKHLGVVLNRANELTNKAEYYRY